MRLTDRLRFAEAQVTFGDSIDALMMFLEMLVELILEVSASFLSWRFFVCMVPAVLVAVLIHSTSDAAGKYLVTVPLVLGALIVGFWWEYRTPG
jgi:hypothetical protein